MCDAYLQNHMYQMIMNHLSEGQIACFDRHRRPAQWLFQCQLGWKSKASQYVAILLLFSIIFEVFGQAVPKL